MIIYSSDIKIVKLQSDRIYNIDYTRDDIDDIQDIIDKDGSCEDKLFIMDDCLTSTMSTNPTIKYLFMNGRHYDTKTYMLDKNALYCSIFSSLI